MAWGAILGAAASIGGGLLSQRGAKDAARSSRPPTTTLMPFGSEDMFGLGGFYRPANPRVRGDRGSLNLSYGDFAPIREMLPGLGGNLLSMVGQTGLPPAVELGRLGLLANAGLPTGPEFGGAIGMFGNALSGSQLPFFGAGARDIFAQGAGNLPGNIADPTLASLLSMSQGAAGQAFGGLGRGSIAPGLASSMFAGAGQQAQAAGQLFPSVYNDVLGTMRASAAPFEQRAFQDLQQNLFNTGRMGTTGGGLQTEAFARGLGQADLQRQLAAFGEGRATQGQALASAQGLAGIGSGVASLDDQLLTSAFSRFGDAAGLSGGFANTRLANALNLSNTQFGRFSEMGRFGSDIASRLFGMESDFARFGADITERDFASRLGLSEAGFGRAQDILGTEVNLAGLPLQLGGTALAQALQAISGAGAVQGLAMNPLQFALSAEQAAANARIGSGSNQVAWANSPLAVAGAMGPGTALTQLGTALMGNDDIRSAFGRMFQTQPWRPERMTGYDPVIGDYSIGG